jgi:dTDP-4-dehydrorhamnose 3,5-epimerase
MKFSKTALDDVVIIEPDVFRDGRGFFMETFHTRRYEEAGISARFVQDNYLYSIRNVIRGLHYQLHHSQAKLIQVIRGEVFDVAVDIRRGSPTFGKWEGVLLSGENKRQMYIPAGFAHGFCVLSDEVDLLYKCSDFYTPGDEYGINWNDPELEISWPVSDPVLSEKDQRNANLNDVPPDHLPQYKR